MINCLVRNVLFKNGSMQVTLARPKTKDIVYHRCNYVLLLLPKSPWKLQTAQLDQKQELNGTNA